MMRMLRRSWDRLSLYLPIVLMGALALGSYWLVETAPSPRAAAVAAPVRQDPDYYMRDFSVRSFLDTGKLRSEVFGAYARHFPDTDMLEIDNVRIRAFDDLERLTTATARRGLTNGDNSEVQLFGDAYVVRAATPGKDGRPQPPVEFRGEYLHVYVKEDRLKSHLPVVLRRGKDTFSADSMAYDRNTGIAQLQGRVRGVLAPAGS